MMAYICVTYYIISSRRKYNPKLRTQDKIEASGAYNREVFKPSPLVKYGKKWALKYIVIFINVYFLI